ncbi:hypothetical protein DER44DRAFT_832040 [Fusarium oxysporum]|nr:hypothetical protein DER44DRAFT_832040 [Fusarium oxysporum]
MKKSRNIGVKFDPSWDEELENACFATVLRDFSPSLAFMIRLLFEVAPDDFPGQSKVMLIDDVSEWQSYDTEGHGGGRIFDSGQEYVELGSLLSSSTHIPLRSSPMDYFADDLSYLFMRKLNEARKWHSRAHLLDTDFFIPVLRRDKQVPMIRK